MTPKELAARITGNQYRSEISEELEAVAKSCGLVVVFGASDDLMEFRGAIHDGAGVWGRPPVAVDVDGLLPTFEDADGGPTHRRKDRLRDFFKREGRSHEIKARWDHAGSSWVYETDIPHETFEIVEDDEPYCRGIVFRLADVATKHGDPARPDHDEITRLHAQIANLRAYNEGRDKMLADLTAEVDRLRARVAPVETAEAAAERGPFQARVAAWVLSCFGPEIAKDKIERNHRFLEESLELVQSGGCTKSEAHQLVDYVFGREVGEMGQEIGGVMNTLAALCGPWGFDMMAEGERELGRVWIKSDQIRAKQAAKPKHSPLPEANPTTARGISLESNAPAPAWTAPKDNLFREMASQWLMDTSGTMFAARAELFDAAWPRDSAND